MDSIRSLQNPRVKEAVKLRDRKGRERQGRIIIDGARELALAIATGLRMIEVFACPELCHTPDARRLLDSLRADHAPLLEVSRDVFAKLAFGARAEGMIGVASTPTAELARLPSSFSEPPLIAVLEGVEKPGNLGAVLRSADGAGVSALVAADLRTDLYNPNAIRASLGTIFTLPLAAATAKETRDWLDARGIRICAARPDGETPYHAFDFRGPVAIVLGSESQGLSPSWSTAPITPLRLPMSGHADSLNVSSTAAVLFYEARRQRGTS